LSLFRREGLKVARKRMPTHHKKEEKDREMLIIGKETNVKG
jgi:hypothetical protein